MKRLETNRLILREWKLSDSPDLFEYAKSELIGPNAGWPPHESEEISKEIIRNFIKHKDVYAIELKSNNKVIGGIGIHERKPDLKLIKKRQCEIGYVLNHKYWGKGIVPEAVNRLIKYGFEEMDLEIVWSGHYSYNLNSKRVNEKCGFKYHMTKKEELKLLNDKKVETLYYKIEKKEYLNRSEFNKKIRSL